MSVSEIRHYFELCLKGESTFDERLEILRQLEQKTAEELEKTKNRYACIQEKIKHCEDIKAGKCEDDCNPLNW